MTAILVHHSLTDSASCFDTVLVSQGLTMIDAVLSTVLDAVLVLLLISNSSMLMYTISNIGA